MLKVELLSYTPEPEKIIASSAKLCYSSVSIDEIRDNLNEENTAKFVDMLSNIGHESPIEHVSFTFGIQGVSRAFLAQLTRHRIASYSVKSQRYVNEKMFEYVIPPEIENLPQAKIEFIKAMEEDQKHYENITAMLKEKHKKAFIDKRIFSKIRSNKNYHPSFGTIILFSLALKLSTLQFEDLLRSAGYSLPQNSYVNITLKYCFYNKIYDIDMVNELIYAVSNKEIRYL